MPRLRAYENAAARQRAYRQRTATKRKRDVTNRESLRVIVERIRFVRDSARDISRANLANWKGWSGAPELHAHALQDDLDNIVERLDALVRGDDGPFRGREFEEWRSKRDQRVCQSL